MAARSVKKLLFITAFPMLLLFVSCKQENIDRTAPILVLKTGDFTQNGTSVPVGGKLKFGITATEGSAPLTNIRIKRSSDGIEKTELDQGVFIQTGGLDFTFNAVKSGAASELWHFFVMNANRDSATTTITVYLGEGSAYGPINHYPSVKIGMQHNQEFPQYLDLHSGSAYFKAATAGNEAAIDLVAFVYTTSGILSPTLSCPAYSGSSSVTGHYPDIASWPVRNSTLYDYFTSDNQLISAQQFDAAENDSLLVSVYRSNSVSGLCKFAFTGRIIPFKTSDGKFGLIKVKHSDTFSNGFMELEIKIQQ